MVIKIFNIKTIVFINILRINQIHPHHYHQKKKKKKKKKEEEEEEEKEEINQKINKKQQANLQNYNDIFVLDSSSSSNILYKYRLRKKNLIKKLIEKEQRLASLMETHGNSFDILSNFLNKRPSKQYLQRTNILKDQNSDKNYQQINHKLEHFFNSDNRPNIDQLINQNIIKKNNIKSINERTSLFSKKYKNRISLDFLKRKQVYIEQQQSQLIKEQNLLSKQSLLKKILKDLNKLIIIYNKLLVKIWIK